MKYLGGKTMNNAICRRDFLLGSAASAAALLISESSGAQPARRFVDVHQHFHMPELPVARPSNGWSIARSLEQMDRFGIATGIVSAPASPALYAGTRAARTLVRRTNEFMATMARDYPGRFGFFAVLPLPDVDACLEEIAYAYETLGADGVGLFSNVRDKWPGDPAFDPVFAELNRRRSVVFIHPIVADCCHNLIPGLNETTLEFDFDTTRAVTSLLLNGTLARYRGVRFIINHSGATVPVLAGRINERMPENPQAYPRGPLYELQQLYYEVAHATYAWPFAALREFVPFSQVLFGSDYPFQAVETTVDGLAAANLAAADFTALERGTAERLFERFSDTR
jgi:predicted TIM-barrel fold metal-dependent hydrolase